MERQSSRRTSISALISPKGSHMPDLSTPVSRLMAAPAPSKSASLTTDNTSNGLAGASTDVGVDSPETPPGALGVGRKAASALTLGLAINDSDYSGDVTPPPGTTLRDLGPRGARSFAGIATRAFSLGFVFALSIVSGPYLLLAASNSLWRLPFFAGALAMFHFLEFWTTAAYNTRHAEIDSFLLTSNWPGYAIAHSAAALECLATHLVAPDRVHPPVLLATGLVLVLVGQTVRSTAMVRAGQSFNHQVQKNRAESHKLVTGGIYSVLRHPSYFGFYWWALGTQLVLGNWVCLAGYAVVLWRFFSVRIRKEEALLVEFFGQDYVEYKKRVGTKLPFCG